MKQSSKTVATATINMFVFLFFLFYVGVFEYFYIGALVSFILFFKRRAYIKALVEYLLDASSEKIEDREFAVKFSNFLLTFIAMVIDVVFWSTSIIWDIKQAFKPELGVQGILNAHEKLKRIKESVNNEE